MRRNVSLLLLLAFPTLALPDEQQGETQLARTVPPDKAGLQTTVHATDILDQRVRTSNGREIGRLMDVAVLQNGKVKEYLVEPDTPKGITVNDEDTDSNDSNETSVHQMTSVASETTGPYLPLPPHNITYNTDEAIVEINLEDRSLVDLPHKARDVSEPETGVYIRDLLGMEVHLDDVKTFGEVKEVLISDDGRKVIAYVVESFDAPYDAASIALPSYDTEFLAAEKENSVREEFGVEAIAFPFGREQLAAMPRYDASAHAPVSDERN